MKTSVWVAALLLITALPPALAQELAKYRYCHQLSCSTKNYKQPDYVALSIVVGRNQGQTIYLAQAKQENLAFLNRNYKQQFRPSTHLTYQGAQPKTPLKPKHRIGEKGKTYENKIV